MPGGDRTGPTGTGPMTGRRQGFCVGNDTAGAYYGRGFGFRRGAGRNFRHGYVGRYGHRNDTVPVFTNDKEEEKRYLEREIGVLKDRLSFLENKLSEIKD